MWNSKLIRSLFLMCILSFSMVGCFSPDKESPGSSGLNGADESSDFYVSDGKFLTEKDVNSTRTQIMSASSQQNVNLWNLNYIKQFTFNVCLTERGSEQDISMQEFIIKDSYGQKIADVKTRRDGCFNWNESFHYNYLAPAAYIKMKRKLYSKKLFKGAASFHIVFNPWFDRDTSDGTSLTAFIPEFEGDLLASTSMIPVTDPQEIKDVLMGKNASELDGQLFIKNIDYDLVKANSKVTSEWNLHLRNARLFVRVRKAEGVYHELELYKGGKYSVMARVLQASGTSNREIVPLSLYNPHFSTRTDVDVYGKDPLFVEWPKFYINQTRDNTPEFPLPFHNFSNDGRLQGQIPLSITNWLETKRFMLVLIVKPESFPYPGFLKPFKGVFQGGFFTSNSGKAKFLEPSDHKLFEKRGFFNTKASLFDEYLDLNENLSNPNGAPVFQDFDASEVQLNFSENLMGEGLTNRGIAYQTLTCLRQKNNNVAPAGQRFKIVVRAGSKNRDLNYIEKDYDLNSQQEMPIKQTLIKTANGAGCISWTDEMWFRHFVPEEYIQVVAEVSEVGSNSHITLKYRVNPWDEGWTFGKDERAIERKFLARYRDQKKVSSRYFLPNFSYQTLRFKYDIDKYLNLIVSKQVLFNFSASTLRYNSNRQGRFGIYHLRDGIYMLKAAMEKNYLDPTTTGVWVTKPPEQDCSELDEEEMEEGAETVLAPRPECYSKSKFIECVDCENQVKSFLEKPFLDEENRSDIRMRRHLDVFSGLVRVVGGKIITPVSFEVKDLRVMRLRSNLFVQIDPVNEWSLWMAKLYSQFYDEVYQGKYANLAKKEAERKAALRMLNKQRGNTSKEDAFYKKDNFFMPKYYHEEKARNIKKMLAKMKGDPRFIHRKLVINQQNERHSTLAPDGTQTNEVMVEHQGKEYRVCEAPNNAFVSWADVFEAFEIDSSDHKYLLSDIDGDLNTFHRETLGYDNSFLNKDTSDGTCLFVDNVIRPLLTNDHSEMQLNPINKMNMGDFIDMESGLEQTTFFGPMTFLSNGNGSNMRPTKNISEFVCPSSDSCDESASEAYLEKSLELAMAEYKKFPMGETDYVSSELNHGERDEVSEREKLSEKDPVILPNKFILEYLNKSHSNEYEKSPYFGSLAYVNNLLVYDYSNRDSQGNVIPNSRDLESEAKRLKSIEKKENEVRSKLFYYLNNYNLDFVTLGSEKVMMYHPVGDCAKIENIPFKDIADETQCFIPVPDNGHVDEKIQSRLTRDLDTKNDVRQMLQSLKISENLAQKICDHQLDRFYKISANIPVAHKLTQIFNKKKRKDEIDDEIGSLSGGIFSSSKDKAREEDLNLEKNTLEEEIKELNEEVSTLGSVIDVSSMTSACVKELMSQVNIDPVKKVDIINGLILDVERKIRVKQTGSYAFKGGKALNINISDQVSMGYSESYSFNIGRGISLSDINKVITGWASAAFPVVGDVVKWTTETFAMGLDMIYGDRKWSDSESNSRSEGNSISEGTFLVMQNATLDVELTDYVQCVTVTFSENFMKTIALHENEFTKKGNDEPLLLSYAQKHQLPFETVKEKQEDIKQGLMKGLMICDESEGEKAINNSSYVQKILPIRENFYYFTQHFTEGDMLDTGDLANHPWLKAIRGKTDMWRFLAKIRSQEEHLKGADKTIPYIGEDLEENGVRSEIVNLVKKGLGRNIPGTDMSVIPFGPEEGGFRDVRGEIGHGDEWPIYQLIKAYHGSLPTFPGVYSAINSPCNYALDFPWGDQASDSFEPVVNNGYVRANLFDGFTSESANQSIEALHSESFPEEARESAATQDIYMTDEMMREGAVGVINKVLETSEYPLVMTPEFPIICHSKVTKKCLIFKQEGLRRFNPTAH